MEGGKEEEWAAVYHESALKIFNSVSWAMVISQHMDLSHSLYTVSHTLHTEPRVNENIIFTILKQSLLLIVPSHDAILPFSAWGQLSDHGVPPEVYHKRLTEKGEVTLQKRRLQFWCLISCANTVTIKVTIATTKEGWQW